MANRPSVLILDDGELVSVYGMLRQLGVDVARLEGGEIRRSVPAPRDLVISAGHRTLGAMPELIAPDEATPAPTWICIHNQDFLPMRERLREMGVNYLLQSALDEDSLQGFLLQLLRSGAEQRRSERLPLGAEIRYRTDQGSEGGRLVELSMEGCRIFTQEAFEPGAGLDVLLPAALGGGEEFEVRGRVLRAAEPDVHGGREGYATVIGFEMHEEALREQLSRIARGERIGTPVSPLADRPGLATSPADLGQEGAPQPVLAPDGNRRGSARHAYDRPVQVLGREAAGADRVLGRDLSLSGVRLTGCPSLAPGTRLTLALYGTAREEPIVLDAEVSRCDEADEVALRFDPLTPSHQQQLERLLAGRPLLDALDQPDAQAGRTFVAEVRLGAPA